MIGKSRFFHKKMIWFVDERIYGNICKCTVRFSNIRFFNSFVQINGFTRSDLMLFRLLFFWKRRKQDGLRFTRDELDLLAFGLVEKPLMRLFEIFFEKEFIWKKDYVFRQFPARNPFLSKFVAKCGIWLIDCSIILVWN